MKGPQIGAGLGTTPISGDSPPFEKKHGTMSLRSEVKADTTWQFLNDMEAGGFALPDPFSPNSETPHNLTRLQI